MLDFYEKHVHPSGFIVFRAGRDNRVPESSLRDNQQNTDLQHDWDFPENLLGLLEIYITLANVTIQSRILLRDNFFQKIKSLHQCFVPFIKSISLYVAQMCT